MDDDSPHYPPFPQLREYQLKALELLESAELPIGAIIDINPGLGKAIPFCCDVDGSIYIVDELYGEQLMESITKEGQIQLAKLVETTEYYKQKYKADYSSEIAQVEAYEESHKRNCKSGYDYTRHNTRYGGRNAKQSRHRKLKVLRE